MEAYVQTLPPSYNGLKAAAAYRLLQANLKRGAYDRGLFLRYLELPRVSPIVPVEWARREEVCANLNEDFMELAMLPPIGDEEPLVRVYLEHFLQGCQGHRPNSQNFCSQITFVASSRRQNFLPESATRSSGTSCSPQPSARSIRDRVEVRLTPENPSRFSTTQPTRLQVDLKNVQELVVRIYELNTASYYRTHDEPIDTDIDLDGLIASHEQTLTFTQPAVQRHREQVELPEIGGRGVWVVDLVGKGLRARALVRRGAIDHVDSFDADGMVFTVIDENRKPVPQAMLWVGGREFVADDQGRIGLPPVVDVVTRRAIVSDGEIADQVTFQHLQEQYRLEAGNRTRSNSTSKWRPVGVAAAPATDDGSDPH